MPNKLSGTAVTERQVEADAQEHLPAKTDTARVWLKDQTDDTEPAFRAVNTFRS